MSERTERPQPYIGVSGVISPQIQHELEIIAQEADLPSTGRLLALGVKAVHKSQWLDVENKYGPDWYPVGEESFTYALHHYYPNQLAFGVAQTYLDVDHVDDSTYRTQFTDRIMQRGQRWIQGIQFDMLPWHDNDDMLPFLESLKEQHGLSILLQCHKAAMKDLKPQGAIRRLGSFASCVDYILFDASHGTGTRLDAPMLDTFLEEAHGSTALAHVGIGVAGGLNAEAVREDLPQLVAKYSELSWDAEGQLHPAQANGKRPLHMPITKDYLQASVAVLLEH